MQPFPSDSTRTRKYSEKYFIENSLEQGRDVHPKRCYISVIQKHSFLSPPTTQSGSVRCQLRPDPTGADPIITGCNNIRDVRERHRTQKRSLWDFEKCGLTCGWPRWWMINWLLIFPGHPVVAKRFSLARDHLKRTTSSDIRIMMITERYDQP